METVTEKAQEEAPMDEKERTSTPIWKKDARRIQIRKNQEGLDNAQETIEYILDENDGLKDKIEELQEKLEENQ